MDATLIELFKHNLWANLRLLKVCTGLNDEQLDASAPGTYGRVRDTLVHILAAEQHYTNALAGREAGPPPPVDQGFPGFEELRQRAQRSGEELIEIAGHVQPTQVISGTMRGIPYTIQAMVFVIQAINHATEHRAHVVTILSQAGITPPSLDGWAYGRKRGVVEMGPQH